MAGWSAPSSAHSHQRPSTLRSTPCECRLSLIRQQGSVSQQQGSVSQWHTGGRGIRASVAGSDEPHAPQCQRSQEQLTVQPQSAPVPTKVLFTLLSSEPAHTVSPAYPHPPHRLSIFKIVLQLFVPVRMQRNTPAVLLPNRPAPSVLILHTGGTLGMEMLHAPVGTLL